MKAKLTFDLDNPDDMYSYKVHNKAMDMASALFEITHNLRRKVENKIDISQTELTNDEVIDYIFNELNQILIDENINTDEFN